MNIPKNELQTRWKLLQSELDRENKAALLVPLGTNFYYLFGKQGYPTERVMAGIIPRDGDPFIFSPSFERSNVERSTGIDDIITWKETDNAYQILGEEFKNRGINGEIGVDPKLWIIEVERISKYSNLSLHSAGEIIDHLRIVKSDWELNQLKAATKASADGILAALPQIKQGMTEKEFEQIVAREISGRSGNPLSFGAIQFGENSAIPHGMPTDRRLNNDEVVLVDAGTSVNGYQGDITITVPFGKPKDFEKIYEIVYEANRLAFNADREGITGAELDKIARDHIAKKEYGKYFTHRLGHGIGLEVHEEPYIVGTNNSPLMAGNCHTIEPGIYIPGKFGVRIEDDAYVTKDGVEMIYETPRHNFSLF